LFSAINAMLAAASTGKSKPLKRTGWAFVALTAGAIIWIIAAYLAKDYALMAQSIAISVNNGLGIYRWLIWRELDSSDWSSG
jgi:hypothetical protein